MPTATEREKRQLEEIAHLFFSDRSEEKKPRPAPGQNLSKGTTDSVVPRAAGSPPFWIRPRAAPGAQEWVDFFLLNLALLFQLADEPVVWIPSHRQDRSRSESGLPARLKARLAGMASAGLPLSYCGPMGLRVVPRMPGETNGQLDEALGQPSGWCNVSLVGYRYVLAEEPWGPLPWDTLPCLEVWLVGNPPWSEPRSSAQERRGAERRFSCKSAFVVVGVASEEEARRVGRQWKEAKGSLASGGGEPESLGFVPGALKGPTGGVAQAMVVLENPLGWQTLRLQEIATKIRARRPLATAAPRSPA